MEYIKINGEDSIQLISSKTTDLVGKAGQYYDGGDIDSIMYHTEVEKKDMYLFTDGFFFTVEKNEKVIEVGTHNEDINNNSSVIFVGGNRMEDVVDPSSDNHNPEVVNYIKNTSPSTSSIDKIFYFTLNDEGTDSDKDKHMKAEGVSRMNEYTIIVDEFSHIKVVYFRRIFYSNGKDETKISSVKMSHEQLSFISDLLNEL